MFSCVWIAQKYLKRCGNKYHITAKPSHVMFRHLYKRSMNLDFMTYDNIETLPKTHLKTNDVATSIMHTVTTKT
jgi:hypothetical protein